MQLTSMSKFLPVDQSCCTDCIPLSMSFLLHFFHSNKLPAIKSVPHGLLMWILKNCNSNQKILTSGILCHHVRSWYPCRHPNLQGLYGIAVYHAGTWIRTGTRFKLWFRLEVKSCLSLFMVFCRYPRQSVQSNSNPRKWFLSNLFRSTFFCLK